MDEVAIEFGLKEKEEITDDTENESVPGTEKDMCKGKVTKTSTESSEKCVYFG